MDNLIRLLSIEKEPGECAEINFVIGELHRLTSECDKRRLRIPIIENLLHDFNNRVANIQTVINYIEDMEKLQTLNIKFRGLCLDCSLLENNSFNFEQKHKCPEIGSGQLKLALSESIKRYTNERCRLIDDLVHVINIIIVELYNALKVN